MKIIYEAPVMYSGTSRKVVVNGEHFTYLHRKDRRGVIVSDKPHPHVDLVKLFTGALQEETYFHSDFDLHIEVKIQ